MDTGQPIRGSALHNSLLQANMLPRASPNHPFGGQDELSGLGSHSSANVDPSAPGSVADSRYGSSRDENSLPMSALGTSQRTLGPLDATLPASFDRTDYSKFARFGPYASSVPSKFGMESPPPSLPNSGRPGALQSLYISAFGDEESHIASTELSQSPRVTGEDQSSQRPMHSSIPVRRPGLLSSSYSRPENMERMLGDFTRERAPPTEPSLDGSFAFEEDFVPSSLQELLTPAERNRRLSRTDEEGASNFRHSLTAPGTPGDSISVIGSPPVGSPGGTPGWGPIVMRQKRDEDHGPISSIGHVGSPLRNSYQHGEPSPTFRPLNRPPGSGDVSPFPGSPNRGNSGISVLTQTLQRARLSSRSDSYGAGDMPPLPKSLGLNGKQMERVTSSSHPSNGKAVLSIDEESDTQFPMEEEEDPSLRQGGGFGSIGAVGRSPGLGLDAGEREWESFGSSAGKRFR